MLASCWQPLAPDALGRACSGRAVRRAFGSSCRVRRPGTPAPRRAPRTLDTRRAGSALPTPGVVRPASLRGHRSAVAGSWLPLLDVLTGSREGCRPKPRTPSADHEKRPHVMTCQHDDKSHQVSLGHLKLVRCSTWTTRRLPLRGLLRSWSPTRQRRGRCAPPHGKDRSPTTAALAVTGASRTDGVPAAAMPLTSSHPILSLPRRIPSSSAGTPGSSPGSVRVTEASRWAEEYRAEMFRRVFSFRLGAGTLLTWRAIRDQSRSRARAAPRPAAAP